MSALRAAVLAGGRSRRMGRDKALLPIGDGTLLEQVVQVVRTAELPCTVIGRSAPCDWPHPAVAFRPDDAPGRGPLGGLATALRHSDDDCLLLSCDLPALRPTLLDWLLQRWSMSAAAHGMVLLRAERPEPCCSCYRRAVLPLVAQRLAERRDSLLGLIAAGDFDRVALPEAYHDQLDDVDAPDDWRRVHGDDL